MEDFLRLRGEAEHTLGVAEHMLTVTYPVIQDPKLLVHILEKVYNSMALGVESLLVYERLFKHIPSIPPDFPGKLSLFQARMERRYSLDPSYLRLIQELHEVIELHKKSPVEFRRKDSFVICSDSYRMSTITVESLKSYLEKAKLFIAAIHTMVSKHERLFREREGGV